jgi:PiT family inorganic phosphate transporter
MFGLDTGFTILLLLCILCACAFEFINGFHDTANAVATVIYTNSLKPSYAVVWSGIWNGIGVFVGVSLGAAVAIKIINLLPSEVIMSTNTSEIIAMVMSLLVTAIVWNLGTWYFGIPCSSSHTLIGAILGVGVGYALVNGINIADGVKWGKAKEIGLSLLLSPLIGFSLTIIVMYLFKLFIKDKKFFKEVEPGKKPGIITRIVLILTCTGVSYAHGQNDGQKGIGLMMLVLFGFAPLYFAINYEIPKSHINTSYTHYVDVRSNISMDHLNLDDKGLIKAVDKDFYALDSLAKSTPPEIGIAKENRIIARNLIIKINKNIEKLGKSESVNISKDSQKELKGIAHSVAAYVNKCPRFVIVLIALSLGLGTMVGWKRIVKTIGEKIGKDHLSYAQGASAELVAATTIIGATSFGLPVSTTQVLSSGIAGSMVASKGLKNLQRKTITTIALAWLLTLPVTILLAIGFYLLFRTFF